MTTLFRRILFGLMALVLMGLCSWRASATTWAEPTPLADPVRDGATCLVSEPASSGSYIYQWPSKYDQVFWPLTTPQGVWFCRESGFTAFMGDFDMTPGEKAAVAAHLARIYKPESGDPDLPRLLELLRQSYSQRTKDQTFQITLLRVLAYYNDAELHDHDASARLRGEALAMMEEALQTSLDEALRLEYLFVTAAYHRERGEVEKSDAAVEALSTALSSSRNQKLKGFVEYLTALKGDIAKIVPGGPLAPD